ncbi:M23 family metallopeptidase [Thalassovita aquimarina]|uniref:M23 family metallopeptidase n=1 Tax=Thalassovita aquimarina TaxID=2785917 RepID=A0ABS5HWC1_9RHOB|nr:M23 family metallopeptidase [Thalassovita aquimarina]
MGQQFRRISDSSDTGGQGGNHLGMDVLAPQGTPVLAAANGVVVASYYEPAYGNRVEISHGTDAEGRQITTRSVHLDARTIAKGDHVSHGQQIGRVGSTGALAGTLNHLHFEVHRKEGQSAEAVDPHLYWADGVGRVTCFDPAHDLPDTPVRLTYPLRCH